MSRPAVHLTQASYHASCDDYEFDDTAYPGAFLLTPSDVAATVSADGSTIRDSARVNEAEGTYTPYEWNLTAVREP